MSGFRPYFRSVIRGERRGFAAAVLRGVLAALAVAYRIAVACRSAAFALGVLPVRRAAVPVISVGNLTAGGTGKTPMVEHLARRLCERDRRPAIVSRGYRSERPGASNDEALVLAANLPEVPHVIDADRVGGAAAAVARHGADVVLLDDGFQHRRIARDLDVVLLDGLDPWGGGRVLPRGLMREPIAALRRAGVIAITRADLAGPARVAEIRARVAEVAPGVPVAEVVEEVVGVEELGQEAGGTGPHAGTGTGSGSGTLQGRRVLAFCGIGNPEGFFARLEALGAVVAARRAFADHHGYGEGEMAALREAARAAGAEALVTTQKDAVKLAKLPGAEGILVLKIRAKVRAGEAELERLLDGVLSRRPRWADSRAGIETGNWELGAGNWEFPVLSSLFPVPSYSRDPFTDLPG